MWVLTVLLTVIQLFISNRSAYGFYTKSISNRLIPLSKYKLSNPYYSKPFTANSPKKYSKLVLTRRWLSATSDSNSTPKLDFNEDYYSVLEVIDTIDFKQLKKAYYKLVFKYHPDNKVTDEEKELANKQMMVINGAYRVLRNAETRAQYDKQRRLGMKGVRAGVKGTGGRYNGPTYEEAKQKVSESTTDTKSSSQKDDWTRYTRIDEAAEQYYQTNVNKARQTVNAEYTSPTVSRFWEKYGNGAAPPRKEPPRTEQAYQYSSDIYDEEGFPKFKTGRGDGSVRSLKLYLAEMQTARNRLQFALLSDKRDWGEVTDAKEIQRRLQAIQNVKMLDQMISDVEDEIEGMEYGRDSFGRYSQSGVEDEYYDNDRYSDNYDRRSAYDPYEVQPQTVRDRDNNDGNGPKKRVTIKDDDFLWNRRKKRMALDVFFDKNGYQSYVDCIYGNLLQSVSNDIDFSISNAESHSYGVGISADFVSYVNTNELEGNFREIDTPESSRIQNSDIFPEDRYDFEDLLSELSWNLRKTENPL